MNGSFKAFFNSSSLSRKIAETMEVEDVPMPDLPEISPKELYEEEKNYYHDDQYLLYKVNTNGNDFFPSFSNFISLPFFRSVIFLIIYSMCNVKVIQRYFSWLINKKKPVHPILKESCYSKTNKMFLEMRMMPLPLPSISSPVSCTIKSPEWIEWGIVISLNCT